MEDAPDMSAIRAFVAVCEAGSFSGGARGVGLTRSAAGKALARLEARLGTRLLHRTTRKVALTVDGRFFFDRCSQILADLAEAESLVRRDDAHPTGVLRLALPETFGRQYVLPTLNAFLRKWPELRAEVSMTDRVTDLIGEGYDLAVRSGTPLPDTSMIARVVARFDSVLCAAPDYLAAHGEPRTVDDLPQHSRLTLGTGHWVHPWALTPPNAPPVRIERVGRLHFDSASALRQAALAGLGVTYLPGFLIAADIADGALVPLLADHETDEVTIHVVYPHRRHLSAKVRMFVDQLGSDLASALPRPTPSLS